MQTVTQMFYNHLKVSGNEESTKNSKRRALKFFVQCFGDIDITEIRYFHGEDFRNLIASRGACAKTINLYVGHISRFLNWCVKREYIRISPWAELTRLPIEDKVTKSSKQDEVFRMFRVANLIWKGLILLGCFSGLRQSEALNLIYSDFNFDDELLEITPKKNTAETFQWRIKNRKNAYAPLPQSVMLDGKRIEYHDVLREIFAEAPKGQPYPFVTKARYEKVMVRSKGNLPITKDHYAGNFDRQFKKICSLACVKPHRYQSLRVTFVNSFPKAEYDIKDRQILARHLSASTTIRCYRYEDEKELLNRANQSLKLCRT